MLGNRPGGSAIGKSSSNWRPHRKWICSGRRTRRLPSVPQTSGLSVSRTICEGRANFIERTPLFLSPRRRSGEQVCVAHFTRDKLAAQKHASPSAHLDPAGYMKQFSRRDFLKAGSVGVALPYLVPSSVFGADAPSNRITIGFIGTGDHGTTWNLKRYLELKAARVLVVCDVDGYRMRRAKAMVDAEYDNEDCATTKDFREVVDRKDIDAVMISTPDHWHTLISVMAARAGKDVQCEKPTLTISEGKILIETIRKQKRVFQTSTEDRSLPMYHRMAELVRNGRIGKLQKIEVILPKQPEVPGDPTPQPVPPDLDWEMWLGPAPYAPYTKDRVHFNFRWIWDYSGGIICDWGAHLFDTAQWANNTERTGPITVEGTGDRK